LLKGAEVPPRGAESIAEVRRISSAAHMLATSWSLKRAVVSPRGVESAAKIMEHFIGGAHAGQ